MKKTVFEGVGTALITPMDEHGNFNFGLSRSHLAEILEKAKCIIVEVNTNMPWVNGLTGSEINICDVDMVVEGENPELAQLFVEYMISEETQNIIAECMNEAPVHSKATMAEELQVYLAYGEEAMLALKEFDEAFITEAKGEWIDTFQRTVNVQ